MRRAFTTVEAIVALVMVAIVIGAMMQLLGTTRRMNDASRGSQSVASTLLIQEALAMDLRQLGVDAKRTRLFDMSENGISFYRVVFAGKQIKLRPVRWVLRNARLERTEGGVTTPFDGHLSKIAFSMTGDARDATRYLRVELTMLGSEKPVEQVLLARLPVPLQIANPELEASSRMIVEGELLPIN